MRPTAHDGEPQRFWQLWRQDLALAMHPPASRSILRQDRPALYRALRDLAPHRTPFEHLALSLALAPAVRDALGLLVLAATRRAAAVPRSTLGEWASRAQAERAQIASALEPGGPLLQSGLVVEIAGPERMVAASPALVSLITGDDAPDDAPVRLVATDADASIGCIEPARARRAALILSALEGDEVAGVVHLTGPRGSGRLRLASTLAAYRGAAHLAVLDGAALVGASDVDALVDAACIEATRHTARLVVANADLVTAPAVAILCARARRRRLSVWTTASAALAWTASSLAVHVAAPCAALREAAWSREAARAALAIADLPAIAALDLSRTQIDMAVRIAAATHTNPIDRTFALAIAPEIAHGK